MHMARTYVRKKNIREFFLKYTELNDNENMTCQICKIQLKHYSEKTNIPLYTFLSSCSNAEMGNCFPESHSHKTQSTVEALSQNLQISPWWPPRCSAPRSHERQNISCQ